MILKNERIYMGMNYIFKNLEINYQEFSRLGFEQHIVAPKMNKKVDLFRL